MHRAARSWSPLLLASVCAALAGTGSARAQTPDWRIGPAMLPAGSPVLTYDATRRRVVLVIEDDTWECDGAVWQQVAVAQAPGLRMGMTLAADPGLGVTLLFGGIVISAQSAHADDLWAWDGSNWTSVAAAQRPPGRWNAPIAYDSARRRLVLYGGETATGRVNDTWEFDGVTWTQRFPPAVPSAYLRHNMVYDPVRAVVVLFGGLTLSGTTYLDETWEWNGAAWQQRNPLQRPSPRSSPGMTFDTTRNQVLLVGGRDASAFLNDTWAYDGITWSQVATSGRPPGDPPQGLCFDTARGEAMTVVSRAGGPQTWTLQGNTWSSAVQRDQPGARDGHALVHDPARGVDVMFGGALSGSLYFEDTWECRGGAWYRMTSGTQPPGREATAMAFDPVTGAVLMFGGAGTGGGNDTWHHDRTGWTPRQPASRPPSRSGHALATDLARGRVVLFGGRWFSVLNDTWEWDGSNWLLRTPRTVPPARAEHRLAFDPVRGRTMLYGGRDASAQILGDHWEWDGSDWTAVPVTPSPGPRAGHGLVYDSDLGVVVLFGGYLTPFAGLPLPRNDTWRWNGSSWTQYAIATPPPPRSHVAMAHDANLHRTVLYSGSLHYDEWTLGAASSAGAARYGTACPGAFGLPALRERGLPVQGNRWFGVQASAVPAGALVALGVGVLPASVALPGGCTVLVDQALLLFALADSRGAQLFPLPIPDTPAVRGMALHAQAVTLDPAGAFAGLLAMSAGLRILIDV